MPTSDKIAGLQRTTPWEKKVAARERVNAMKAREREMKEEKQNEADRRKQTSLDRKRRQEERARIDAMAQKMSQKKLDRKKRRLGLTKKLAHGK